MESGFPSATQSRTDSPAGPQAGGSGVPRTKICVYCGSSPGKNPAHLDSARELAKVMAERGIGLVYGGGTVGLMGEVAKTLVSLTGPDFVHGIIPEALIKWERDDTYSTKADDNGHYVPNESVYGRTTVVKDMHTRKQLMAREVIEGGPGSGFIALSGGYGTMEELLETVTWNQIGIHNKGVCVLNINGFYDGLIDFIAKSSEEGFIGGDNKGILVNATSASEAVDQLRDYKVAEQRYPLEWGMQ